MTPNLRILSPKRAQSVQKGGQKVTFRRSFEGRDGKRKTWFGLRRHGRIACGLPPQELQFWWFFRIWPISLKSALKNQKKSLRIDFGGILASKWSPNEVTLRSWICPRDVFFLLCRLEGPQGVPKASQDPLWLHFLWFWIHFRLIFYDFGTCFVHKIDTTCNLKNL